MLGEVFANALARTRSEEKLMAAEAKYRRVADCAYDWAYMVGVDGNLEYVSPSCERISGYTTNEFMNDPSLLKRIVHPQDRAIWEGHDAKGLHPPLAGSLEFRIERRDGQVRWIEHHCAPVREPQGDLRGYRASNRDITQRKLVEEALRQSKMFNQAVLMSLPDQLAVLDRSGFSQQRRCGATRCVLSGDCAHVPVEQPAGEHCVRS